MARSALFVSTSTYADGQLAQLPSAARDAVSLGELFGDPRIGPFSVSALESPSAQEMRLAMEDLFSEATADDTVVLYLSGHGLKDLKGNLYFAAHDTRPNRLQSTAVSAQLLCSLLNDSRAESAVVFLDCCYGGAFARGMVARAAGDPQVGDAFASLGAGARARAVITASSAIEYAFEGERLTDSHVEPSVFASAMLAGIADGDADRDGDGWVGLSELFEYIRQRIQRAGQPQTPHLWTFGASGDLRVTRNPRGPRSSVLALPPEIRELLSSPVAAARLGAATDLRDRAVGEDLPMARAAVSALRRLAEDDSQRVRDAAAAALAACAPRLEPERLSLTPDGTAAARVTGAPVALDVAVDAVPDGVTATLTGDRLDVLASVEVAAGESEIRLRWAGGNVSLLLIAEAAVNEPSASRTAPKETTEEATEAAVTTRPGRTEAAPVAAADQPPDESAEAAGRKRAARSEPAASSTDHPVWLLATAGLWLVSLFLPLFTANSATALEFARIPGLPTPALMGVSGLAMLATGVYRLRFSAGRISLGVALFLVLAIQFLGVALLGEVFNDNEGVGVGSVAMSLAVVAGLVYAALTIIRLGRRSWYRDRPIWLLGAGVLWLVTSFLPLNYASGWDASPLIYSADDSAALAALIVFAGLGAIGAGWAGWTRPGSLKWRPRVSQLVAILFALLVATLAITLMIAAAGYDGIGQAAVFAVEPLAFAVVYLVDLVVRSLRTR